MKTTLQVRPEQAARLIALDGAAKQAGAVAKAADQRFALALDAVLVGLVGDADKVVSIAADGTVTLDVADKRTEA